MNPIDHNKFHKCYPSKEPANKKQQPCTPPNLKETAKAIFKKKGDDFIEKNKNHKTNFSGQF